MPRLFAYVSQSRLLIECKSDICPHRTYTSICIYWLTALILECNLEIFISKFMLNVPVMRIL